MRSLFLLFLASLQLLLSGCATTREMAGIVYHEQAEGGFLDQGKQEDFAFYVYNGEGERPVAFLAIAGGYTLKSEFWSPTRMSGGYWREMYHSTTFMQEDDYRARAIVSRSGDTIGYIISRHYQLFAWQEEPGSTVVIVPPPTMSPWQPEYIRWRILDR